MQARYGGLRALAADFTQIYHGAAGRALSESGRLLIRKPNKMRWEYLDPEIKIFISTGRKTYFYVPDDAQVTETDIKESSDPQIPFLFLLRRGNLSKDFESISFAAGEKPAEAGNVVLKVVAKKVSPEFRNILVEANPRSFQVRRISRIEPSGTRNDFLLSNLKENPPAPDDLFKFTPPAGVQVLKGN